MEQLNFDTVILGGGPAGLSAAIYAARGAVSTAIVDVNMLGGQPSNYLELENYPGFQIVGGYDLMEKFEEHADKFGVKKFPMQEIESVDLQSKIIKTKEYEFVAKTIIIATGAQPMKLGVPGEKEFVGRGVSYCAVCDGAFYKNKVVAVVGGGNAAEDTIFQSKASIFADKVYVIHRRNELRADKIVQERAFKNEKIEFVWDSVVKEIKGENLVTTLVLENVKTKNVSNLQVNGVFPYIGMSPNVEMFSGQLQQDARGFIVTDDTMATSLEGVFAVGDVRTTPLRQVVTAAADGAVGAVYAVKYLETVKEAQKI